MMLCEAVTDRMALVRHGHAEWTAEEAAHLASCAECAREWAVVDAAARLGAGAAGRVDPARVGAAVLTRLGGERRRRRWWRAGGLVGLAAAAALAILVVSRGPGQGPTTVAAGGDFYVPVAELESLDETQLEAVLEGLEAPITDGSLAAPPALGDLDDVQLERVLRSLEG